MKLTTKDRLTLLAVLPKEGAIIDMKILRDLKSELGITEDERKALNFRPSALGGTDWDEIPDKDVNIGERGREIIREAFNQLDKQGKVHEDFLDTYDKFFKE